MREGFRWCPHCKAPHGLDVRICEATGQPLDPSLHHSAGSAPHPLVGTMLGNKYTVLRLLGAGGMGQVFEAENVQIKRLVAIKVVGPAAGTQALLRLEREAQLVASIQHPNICDVHDFGRTPSGGPYIVFERLFGETLAGRQKRTGRLSVRRALDVFSQILSGLHAAHAAKIVHRDLKPQNVFLVDRLGCPPLVKLVDFGFAHDLSARGERITRPGHLCGTVQYMSPEQLRAGHVDHRSDLFAVGIMLYEALAGRHPFEAESRIDLQANILRAAPTSLRRHRPDIGVDLERVVSWALAASPAARPSTAIDLQRALLAVAQPRPLPSLVEEEPVSTTDPIWFPPTSSPEA